MRKTLPLLFSGIRRKKRSQQKKAVVRAGRAASKLRQLGEGAIRNHGYYEGGTLLTQVNMQSLAK